ncbi:MAG: helicase, partial [Oscillospiraceae bacterium]
AGDRIMDATARLLAPKKAPAATIDRPRNDRGGDNRKNSRDVGKNGIASSRQKAVQPPMGKGMANPSRVKSDAPAGKPDGSRRGRPQNGSRRGPPEQPRRDSQKDSTEQESLMKPYYLND